ncbi:unnamed protein product, partial [Allacma fusca]
MDWDEKLPDDIMSKWMEYASNLPSLEGIRIPRYLQYTPEC